jgi:hypothetical protein
LQALFVLALALLVATVFAIGQSEARKQKQDILSGYGYAAGYQAYPYLGYPGYGTYGGHGSYGYSYSGYLGA